MRASYHIKEQQVFSTERKHAKVAKTSADTTLKTSAFQEQVSTEISDAEIHQLKKENKLLRAHLEAAYTEIGKLSVKLIEASLGMPDSCEVTDFQSAETQKGRGEKTLEPYLRTPEDTSSSALQKYMVSSTLEQPDISPIERLKVMESSKDQLFRNLEQEWNELHQDNKALPKYYESVKRPQTAELLEESSLDEVQSHHVHVSCIDECNEADEEDRSDPSDRIEDDCYILTDSSRSQVVQHVSRYS